MDKQDILWKSLGGIFSCRAAVILIREGKVLLQREAGGTEYAFPGGHVGFGETSEEALRRELREEMGVEVRPERLLWVGEVFFPWGPDRCHQLGFYYLAALADESALPLDRVFTFPSESGARLEFSWIDLADAARLQVYPLPVRDRLSSLPTAIERFVDAQE